MRLPKKQIIEYFRLGIKELYWYEITNQSIKKLFPDYDIEIVIKLLAATSASATLKSNVGLFFKALYQYENEKEFEGFTPSVIVQLEAIRNGQEIPGRKLRNFANAMLDDHRAIVVDLWIMRACNIKNPKDREVPTTRQYDHIERQFRRYASEYEVDPRQFCAAVWAGVRRSQTGRFNPLRYCDVIKSKIKPDLFANDEPILTPKGIYQ